MDGYNLFEPDLELDVNTIPYEDMGIQGVWPRKQRTPSDVFPANANLVARGEDNKARWCKADKDGILYTHDVGGGGGGGLSTVNLFHQLVWNNLSYSDTAEAFLNSYGVITTLYGITFALSSAAGAVGNISLASRATGHNLFSLAIACGPNGQFFYTQLFPYGIIPSADGLTPEVVDDLKMRTPFNDGIASFGLWWT